MRIIKKYKYQIALILIILLVIGAFLIRHKLYNQKYQNISVISEVNPLEKEVEKGQEVELCTVDIKGAIKKPGVYNLDCQNNISNVIEIAGGLLASADTSVINLAKKITNEMVIIIYTKEEVKNSNIVDTVVKVVEKECICPNIQNDGCINTEVTSSIGDNSSSLININTASLELLQTLPGIGESKAKAIIKYREQNNGFNTIEEIQNVDGIGSKLYEEIKTYITT